MSRDSSKGFVGLLCAAMLTAAYVLPQEALGPIRFENVVSRSGIAFRMNNSVTPQRHQVETMIAGVALFDYNNDGLPDIYFVNGAQLPSMDKSDPKFWNRLYRNNGNGTFTDVTADAGVRGEGFSMGVAAGDFDNDGFVDLYVTGVTRNQLLHNNGNGTFTDVTVHAGVGGTIADKGKAWSVSAGWFDYDNDGFLDLLVINYVKWSLKTEPSCSVSGIRSYCAPGSFEGQPNILYHNNGDGTFTDVSERSGIAGSVGKGMGVAFADYDNDGFTDVFISNDTYRNFLFHNQRDGTFKETAIEAGVAYNENGKSIAGMGTDFKDIDNDGRPDIFVVGMVSDTFPLFRNRGKYFEDITSASGIARATGALTAWGAGVFDFDNDGNKDLFAACGSILDNSEEIDHLPAKQRNVVLRNSGNGHFVEVGAQAGASFQVPATHRGVAFADLNNDGKIDAVVVTQNTPPELFMNRSPGRGHWLLLHLVGSKSNRDGIGARVRVMFTDGTSVWNQATTSVGYASSSDKRVHFGFGSKAIERISIRWPSGIETNLLQSNVDVVLTVVEPSAIAH